MLQMSKVEQNFKKFLVIRNTVQDEKVNSILDKILLDKKLDKTEVKFLDNLEEILKNDLKDYSHLSKNIVVEVIDSLIKKNIKIICDLTDRDGKIGEEIISIKNNFLENNCFLTLKNSNKIELLDKFLYNLTYSLIKHEYSLTIQDEYFEKIFIDKDEN